MKKKIFSLIAILGIMLAAGCNQSEPENNNGSGGNQPAPRPSNTGTQISASSLSDLQGQINNANVGAELDLSLCGNISGELTINKSLTIKNFNSAESSINISSENVTLNGLKVNSVTTQQAGSSSLKIANSSLSTLTLGGDGVARSGSRAVAKPKSLIFDSVVTSEVCFDEAVELDIANIGLNIASFTGSAEATINMTDSAYAEYQSQNPTGQSGITINNNISDDTMYAYLDQYGYAGDNFFFKTKEFPSDCVGYISKLLKKYKNNAQDVPSISLTSNDYFQYYWNAYSQDNGVVAMDGAILNVDIPLDAAFDKDEYETALKNAGYTEGPSGLEYTNQYEIEEMFDKWEEEIDESNYMTVYTEMMQQISNMVMYKVEVDIDWDWYYGENGDEQAIPKYYITYTFYAMKYGDLYGEYFPAGYPY